MSTLTYFSVVGNYFAAAGDGPYDAGDPALVPMSGLIKLTPLITAGDTIEASTLSPPASLYLAPITAHIKNGRIQVNGENGIRLIADTDVLNLDGNLYYRVDFPEGLKARGVTYSVKSFTFQAPNTDLELNLVDVTPVPGQSASGITKIAPGGVRIDGDNNVVFTFAGVDLPDPIPAGEFIAAGVVANEVADQLPAAVATEVTAQDIPSQIAAQVPPAISAVLPAAVDSAVTAADIPGQVADAATSEVAEQVPPAVASAVPPVVSSSITAADIPGQVAAAVASDGAVVDAAEAAVTDAAAGLDLVLRSDPGIPRAASDSTALYQQIWTGPNGEFIRGDRLDGYTELPRAVIASGTTKSIAAEGLSWVPYLGPSGPSDPTPELVLDTGGSVPSWVLTRWKSRMGLGGFSSSTSWPMDLVILAGQSNATQLSTLTATIEPAVDDVLTWSGTAFASASGTPWLGSGFARRYAELHGRPEHRRVAIVPCAVGSTGFSTNDPTWDRTKTGAAQNLYLLMISKALAALAAAPAGSKIVAIVWSQGEQDSGVGLATYQAKLDDLIAQARTDLSISDLPFIISSLTPEIIATGGSGYGSINDILVDTPRRIARTSFTAGPKNMADSVGAGIHWNPMGQTLRGKWMAETGYDNALLNMTTAVPLPPVNIRVSRSGNTALVEYDHPQTRATAYNFAYCTDGVGTTWTAVTLASATALSFTLTVTAGTPLRVRATSTNEVGTSFLSMEVHA